MAFLTSVKYEGTISTFPKGSGFLQRVAYTVAKPLEVKEKKGIFSNLISGAKKGYQAVEIPEKKFQGAHALEAGSDVLGSTLTDSYKRLEDVFKTWGDPKSSPIELITSQGESALGVVNVAFTPIT